MKSHWGGGSSNGGFALLLAKKLVDELIYSQLGNEVLLVKYVDSAAFAKPLTSRQSHRR